MCDKAVILQAVQGVPHLLTNDSGNRLCPCCNTELHICLRRWMDGWMDARTDGWMERIIGSYAIKGYFQPEKIYLFRSK